MFGIPGLSAMYVAIVALNADEAIDKSNAAFTLDIISNMSDLAVESSPIPRPSFKPSSLIIPFNYRHW